MQFLLAHFDGDELAGLRAGQGMPVPMRKHDHVTQAHLDRLAVEQLCAARPLCDQMKRNDVLGLRHEQGAEGARWRCEKGPARPQLGLEKHRSGESYRAQYM